jgi:CheY-like chemotaxis protein
VTVAGERILAIDDDRFFRTLYADLLGQEGYAVQAAASGEEGVRLIAEREFDLVICDIVMRGMDGLETLAAIRQLRPQQPVVMVTGERDVATAVEALKRGAADYVNKPVVEEEFKLVVRRLLAESRVSREHADLVRENLGQLRLIEVLARAQEILAEAPAAQAPERLLALAMAEVGAGRGAIFRAPAEDRRWRVGCQTGFETAPFGADGIESEALAGLAARGLPGVLDRAELAGLLPPEAVDRLAGEAVAVPLRLGGRATGAMVLAERAGGEPFLPGDLQLLTGLAPSASLALARAWPEVAGPPAASPGEGEIEPGEARLERHLRHEVHRGLRYRRQFCLVVIGWGDEAGGAPDLSAALSRRIARTVREADLVIPLAGPAAAIIAPETDYLGGLALARRISRALPRTGGRGAPGAPPALECGLAAFPDHGTTATALLARARVGLFRAKQVPYLLESLWEFVDRLTDEAAAGAAAAAAADPEPQPGEAPGPAAEEALKRGLRPVPSREEFEATARAIEEALELRGPAGGVVYVGVGRLSQLQGYLDLYMTVQRRGFEVFVFGEDDWVGWDPERLTPVVARDGEIGRRRFLLFYSLDACAALLAAETADGSLRGFSTENPLLVNALITKVKARYL